MNVIDALRRQTVHYLETVFVRATEAAAIAASSLVGRGDEDAIDQSAVDAMRAVLANVAIAGTVANGEEVGTGEGPQLDIAVDPIDGTTLASRGGPGSISLVAGAQRGSLFRTRVPYMEKIVVGPRGAGKVRIDAPVQTNIVALARALRRPVREMTVALLDRPRNEHLITAVRAAGARVRLIGDGNIAAAILAVLADREGIDMLLGIGGVSEGVITACAVTCLGGDMQARLWMRDEADAAIARDEGHRPNAVLELRDLCASTYAVVAATGVTDGELLRGVRDLGGAAQTQSLVLSYPPKTCRTVSCRHNLTRAQDLREAVNA